MLEDTNNLHPSIKMKKERDGVGEKSLRSCFPTHQLQCHMMIQPTCRNSQVTSTRAGLLPSRYRYPGVEQALFWPYAKLVQRVQNWQSAPRHQGKGKTTSLATTMPEKLVTTSSCRLPLLQRPMPSATG